MHDDDANLHAHTKAESWLQHLILLNMMIAGEACHA